MAAQVGRIKLGSKGLDVSAQGLGCMGMSFGYGPPKPETEMIQVIQYAIDNGVTMLDTSDVYGPHTNEILIGKALKGIPREKVQIATKFGVRFLEDGNREICGDPDYVRQACEGSLKRLGIDYVDLYYVHRIDTKTPIELTIGAMKKLVEDGKVRHIGLSEASPETIRRAHAVHPITAVQLEWSLWTRDAEEQVIPTCRGLGIGIVPFSPLGKGFFTSGPEMVEKLADNDFRRSVPRFQTENVEHNSKLFDRVKDMATRKGCTPSQLALAWVMSQGNDVCPIPGTTKIENLECNIKASYVRLTPGEMAQLESIASAAVKGERYPASLMDNNWREANTPPLASFNASG